MMHRDRSQGFSLTEVLVSLALMSSTSLAIVKQQWQTSQLFNQLQQRSLAQAVLDDATEMYFAKRDFAPTGSHWQLSHRTTAAGTRITLYTPNDLHLSRVVMP